MKKYFQYLLFLLISCNSYSQNSHLTCVGVDVNLWSDCFGVYASSNGNRYVGEWGNGKYNGKGALSFANGYLYDGEFKNGKRDGKATVKYPNGDRYIGEFSDDKRVGLSTYILANGNTYTGEFRNDKRDGKFSVTFASGSKFVGDFKDDLINGRGIYTYANGGIYTGEFKDGKKSGSGTYILPSGNKYVGEWKDDKYNGKGVMYSSNGLIINEGIWADNLFIGMDKTKTDSLSPREILVKAMEGKYSPLNCDSKTVYEFNLENQTLKGVFKGDNKIIATMNIPIGSAKKISEENGVYRIGFQSFQENLSTKSSSSAEIVMESNFKVRRTIDSIVNQIPMIKEGVILSSNQKSLDLVKCD